MAATYYVDATSGSDSNTGLSNAQAWQTVAKVNSSVSGDGDKVLFLCGETWSESLFVDWENPTIGAYEMDGETEREIDGSTYTCDGALPTLDGGAYGDNEATCPQNHPDATGYSGGHALVVYGLAEGTTVTIQDIRIQDWNTVGIWLEQAGTNGVIKRVETEDICGVAIKPSYASGSYYMDGWTVQDSSFLDSTMAYSDGADDELFSGAIVSFGNNWTIKNCTIGGSYGEGIGIHGDFYGILIDGNDLYDHAGGAISVGTSDGAIVRNNNVRHSSGFSDGGITANGITLEAGEGETGGPSGALIENNVVTGCTTGIASWDGSTSVLEAADNLVYHNTFVDNVYNFAPWGNYNKIRAIYKGNLSVVNDTANCSHTNVATVPSNQDFTGNFWDNTNSVSMPGATFYDNDTDCSSPDVCGDPVLVKQTTFYGHADVATNTDGQAALQSTSGARDTGPTISGHDTGLDPDTDWPDSIKFFAHTEHGTGAEFGAYVYEDENTGNEPAGCIAWYKFAREESLNDFSGNENHLEQGDVNSGVVLSSAGAYFDGTNDWLKHTALSSDVSDITMFITFTPSGLPAAGSEQFVCGEYDYGAGERNFGSCLYDADDANGATLYLKVGKTDGADRGVLKHLSGLSNSSTYASALVFDQTEDDGFGWIRDSNGDAVGVEATDTSLLDCSDCNSTTETPFLVGATLNNGTPEDFYEGYIKEIVLYDTKKTEADLAEWVLEQMGDVPITPQSISATAETVSSAGWHSFDIVYDRNVKYTGAPYIDVTFDYPAGTVRYYASAFSGDNLTFSAYLGARYRLSTFSNAKVGDVTLNGGTITDLQDQNSGDNTISDIATYPDTDTVILIAGTLTVGTSQDITTFANTAFAENDIYHIHPTNTLNEAIDIDKDNVKIYGMGRKITGLTNITFSGNNGYVGCVTASGTVTGENNESVENESGATEMRGSFVDSQTWFHDAGGLIAAYAGTGNKLVVDDGSGNQAYGFIGEVGSGETLDSELVTDAGIESWTGDVPDNLTNEGTPTITDEAVIVHGGSHSCKVVVDAQYEGINSSNATTTPDKLYKISFWLYGDGTNEVMARIYTGSGDYFYFSSMVINASFIPPASWAQHTMYYATPTGKTAARIQVMSDTGETAGTFYVDDLSIKEVTEPEATAVHIYKEYTLDTEGWNSIDSGIDYNADTSWDFDVQPDSNVYHPICQRGRNRMGMNPSPN